MESPVAWARRNGTHIQQAIRYAGNANLSWSIARIIDQPWDDTTGGNQDLLELLRPMLAAPDHLIQAARDSGHILFPCNITDTIWNDQHGQISKYQWITTTPTGPHNIKSCVTTEASIYLNAARAYGVDLFRIPAIDRHLFRLVVYPSGHIRLAITAAQLSELTGWPLTETEQICHRQ